ncbi:MAG: hypothetical protein JXA00_05015 [Candidatus Thermoplasmatota archaeon]|nr:hypothetical protein [Candidatus Thermoplasmatota archaeon]
MSSKKTDVISASEIGQYMYCACAWQLHRMGYTPQSAFLEPGKQMHSELGDRLDGFERKMRCSRWYALVGIVLLCVALCLFLVEVVL